MRAGAFLGFPRGFVRASGRGEIGRRARFRFWYRKMWGFESLRPHQFPAPAFGQNN